MRCTWCCFPRKLVFCLHLVSLFPLRTNRETNTRYPVYEDEQTEIRMPENSKQTDSSDPWLCTASEYERYLSQSLPPRVQRELEREVQREFGFVGDEAQTRKVVDMVQKLQLRLFRQFESERGASSSSNR